MRLNSIRRRLTITLALLCCVVWGCGSFVAYLLMRAGLIAEFDRANTTDLHALANMAEQNEAGLAFDSTGEYMPRFQREERPDYFQLWDTEGSTVYRSPSLGEADLTAVAGTLEAPKFSNVILPDGLRGRSAGARFVPHEDDEAIRAPGAPPLSREIILVGAFHRQDLDRTLRLLALVLFSVGAVMAGATAMAVTILVRGGLQPLAALAEQAAAIDASSLQVRFSTENLPAELRPIAQRLNDLLNRLETSFARERRFSADVAHELRTPIAELRNLAEVAIKFPDDAAAAQGALADALSIALQMESIATGLLALARCEENEFAPQPERVALATLLDEILEPLMVKVRLKEVAIELDVSTAGDWFTDRNALRIIVSNLLSNAIEHSPPATPVTIRARGDGAADQLLVSNINRDLSVEDIPHLFERFWQKDQARSSSDHCGLGLAVAKAYAVALGMEIAADLRHNEIVITLRAAKTDTRM